MLGAAGLDAVNDLKAHAQHEGDGGKTSGRLHHKSCSEQHLFEIVVIPAGGEPFRLHSDLLALLVLQQAQGHPADDGEVGVGMPLPDPAPVLAERHVELPMQRVLDGPVILPSKSQVV